MLSSDNRVDISDLRRFEPLSAMSEERLAEISALTCLEAIAKGDVIQQHDGVAKDIFLLSGGLVFDNDEQGIHKEVTSGEEDARFSLPSTLSIAAATVATASADAIIFRLDTDMVDNLLVWDQMASPDPILLDALDDLSPLQQGYGWMKNLHMTFMFNNMSVAKIEDFFELAEIIDVKAGDVLIHQGDIGDYYYIIDAGLVLVARETDEEGAAMELAEIDVGWGFGEIALLTNAPRNATVSMLSDGTLLRLSKIDLLHLLQEPKLRTIDNEKADAMIAAGGIWLDLSLESEFNHRHFPDAINIPLPELRMRAGELDREQEIVCCCPTSRRSNVAAHLLAQYGFQTYVLENGFNSFPDDKFIATKVIDEEDVDSFFL